jgi:hypothetical protein
VIEAVALEPIGTRRSALLDKSFSKPLVLVPGIWVACGYDAPLARLDTVQSNIADAKCDRFTVVRIETVLPERRYTIDLYIRPEPTTDTIDIDLTGFEP